MIMEEEVLEDFLAESQEHLDTVEQQLLALEKTAGADETSEILNILFRAVHSIKGAAGFLEFNRITELTHYMENIFGKLREARQAPSGECADVMFRAVDVLRGMLEMDDHGESTEISLILNDLSALTCTPAEKVVEKPAQKLPAVKPVSSDYCYCVKILRGNEEEIKSDMSTLAEIDLQSGSFIMGRSVLEPDLINAALSEFEVKVTRLSPKDYQMFSQKLLAKRDNCPVGSAQVKTAEQKPETMPAVKAESQVAPVSEKPQENKNEVAESKVGASTANGNKAESTIRVDIQLLEQLMSLAGELVLVRNRHLRWAGNNQDGTGREISQRLDTVTTELQTAIMKTRMQPLERVFAKLPRLVREVARQLGKEINLEINGGEVEVDRAILESLADPLTHLLRNSCDHGIEDPETRRRNSKMPAGTVIVNASHESGQILIKVSDDGKGIDPEVIAGKAVEKGLVSAEEVAKMDIRRKLSLIMLPGFSTAASVSNISGRGVGMDVVKSSIEKLGGSIEIDSVAGRGSAILLRLPLTLAIIQSLIVTRNNIRYVIPRINLEEVINLAGEEVSEKVQVVNGQEVMSYHRSLLQLVRLGEVFNHKEKFNHRTREEIALEHRQSTDALMAAGGIPTMNIAVVRVGEYRFGLVVDQTLDMEEIVVKPMHPAQKSIGIFLGATVTGDGKVAPILDVEGIAKHALGDLHYVDDKKHEHEKFAARSDDAQKMLLFECARNERFAIGLAFIRRIYNIRRSDIQKIGDQWYTLLNNKPVTIARIEETIDVSKTDVLEEMYLIMPRYGNRGCGVLASKICGITNLAVDFSEIPQKQTGLLGTASVDGVTTIFPDIYHICEVAGNPDNKVTAHKQIAPSSDGSRKRVLLAEDAPFFRQLISNYMRRENLIIETAANGAEALEYLQNNEYDLLLSDIEMPVLDGLELARRVRSSNIGAGKMPIVALTSLDTEEDKRQCLEAGFDEYMVKLNRELLLKTLRKYLS